MFRSRHYSRAVRTALLSIAAMSLANADTTPLTILDPGLYVTTAVGSGLTQPIGIVFLSSTDFLVLKKASGQVK